MMMAMFVIVGSNDDDTDGDVEDCDGYGDDDHDDDHNYGDDDDDDGDDNGDDGAAVDGD